MGKIINGIKFNNLDPNPSPKKLFQVNWFLKIMILNTQMKME